MELVTASAIVSYAIRLEEDLGRLYEELANRYSEAKDVFLSLAKENRSNKVTIERVYQGVISDKLEACFIKTLNTDDYSIEVQMPADFRYIDVLKRVLEMEERIKRFLSDAAESMGALVPDVSWTFERMTKKRSDRILRLKTLLERAA